MWWILLAILVAVSTWWWFYRQSDIVIVTSHWKEDLTWLKTQSRFKVVLIDHEGARPPALTSSAIIPNKGREASSYLRYIIDNYDTLPEHIAFIHGHEKAWHHKFEGSLLDRIRRADYLPLNGYWTDTDTQHPEKIKKHWHVIEPWVGPKPPMNGYTDGGAQFVVSRRRVHRHPKGAYEHWYNVITTSEEHFDMGVMFEYAWHYIMGENWVLKNDTRVHI
jgi:hypothetical protein